MEEALTINNRRKYIQNCKYSQNSDRRKLIFRYYIPREQENEILSWGLKGQVQMARKAEIVNHSQPKLLLCACFPRQTGNSLSERKEDLRPYTSERS